MGAEKIIYDKDKAHSLMRLVFTLEQYVSDLKTEATDLIRYKNSKATKAAFDDFETLIVRSQHVLDSMYREWKELEASTEPAGYYDEISFDI